MYVSYKDMRGFGITGAHDRLGSLSDLYVDSQRWQTRYLVLEAGSLLASNKLLLSSDQVSGADVEKRALQTSLGRADLESAPSAGSVQTVDDLNQPAWSIAYGHSLMQVDLSGSVLPYSMIEPMALEGAADDTNATGRRHLRSANELRGYELQGADDRIGIVTDLILNPAGWSVAWLAVDTGNWLPGRLVVVSPNWVRAVSWEERSLSVELTTRQIEGSPPLANLEGLELSAEEALHAYYALPMI